MVWHTHLYLFFYTPNADIKITHIIFLSYLRMALIHRFTPVLAFHMCRGFPTLWQQHKPSESQGDGMLNVMSP